MQIQTYLARIPGSHAFLLSALFFVGLELISLAPSWLIPLSLIMLTVLGGGITLLWYEEKHKFQLLHTVLPLLTAVGLTGLSFFLTRDATIHGYFFISAGIFYWLLNNGARQAYPTWNWVLSTIILFANISLALGLAWNLTLSVLPVVSAVTLIIFLISWQAIERVAPNPANAALVSLALAIGLGQITWTLQFLPVHWLVQAGIITAGYYVAFHLISLSYQRRLGRQDFIEYASLGLLTFLVLLLTARWR